MGKTSLTANPGGYWADPGQRVPRVDAGPQSTLSIYYALEEQAPAGLIADTRTEGVVSRAAIAGLDLIYSDDPEGRSDGPPFGSPPDSRGAGAIGPVLPGTIMLMAG